MLLRVSRLQVHFPLPEGPVRAVNGVDLELDYGEALGLVGETGSGKTVLGLALVRLLPAEALVSGEILYRGRDILPLTEEEMRLLRGREIAVIFQNPSTALNPTLTVGEQIAEALQAHRRMKKPEAWRKAREILESTGVPGPRVRSYPHELSGGMKQRAMIAIGLACAPRLLVADEPTRGLDLIVQRDIVNLLGSVTKRASRARSLLLITHDLAVAAELTDRLAVMYAGVIVECGPTREMLRQPRHPYTRGLLRSHPSNGLLPIEGCGPALGDLPPGCSFHPRCGEADDRCCQEVPPVYRVDKRHYVRCFHAGSGGT